MAKWRIDYTCYFLGDYGWEVIEQDEEPEPWQIEELAIQHFQPDGEVTLLEGDDE